MRLRRRRKTQRSERYDFKLVDNHFKFQSIDNNEVDALHFVKPSSNSRRQHIAYMCLLIEWYRIGEHQPRKLLSISCSFYYLVASTACFVHIMKIQVLAEREQKIQTEVKEIRKVFYCELCNKQYKLAMEFEVHLSSYDHNHRKVNGLSLSLSLTHTHTLPLFQLFFRLLDSFQCCLICSTICYLLAAL